MLSCFSLVQISVTAWTVTCQSPLSMGFFRQEYWSGVPCPPPGKRSYFSLKIHKHSATLMRVPEIFKTKCTEVLLIDSFSLHSLGYLRSTAVQTHEMENSRNKQFINLKLHNAPSCMIKSHPALLCSTWVRSHCFPTLYLRPSHWYRTQQCVQRMWYYLWFQASTGESYSAPSMDKRELHHRSSI